MNDSGKHSGSRQELLDGSQARGDSDFTTHGKKNFLRRQVERLIPKQKIDQFKTIRKAAEVDKFKQKHGIDVIGITDDVCQDKDNLHKVKVMQDVKQFLDPENPRMFASKYPEINDDAVAVLNQLINKSEAVRKRVGETIFRLLAGEETGFSQGIVPLESKAGYRIKDIRDRNRVCGVPEDWGGKKSEGKPITVKEGVDIQSTLEYVLAREEVIGSLIRAHDYRSSVGKFEFLNPRLYKGSDAKKMLVNEYVQERIKEYDKKYGGHMPPEIKNTDFDMSTEKIPWKDAVWDKAKQLAGLKPIPEPKKQQPDQAIETYTDISYLLMDHDHKSNTPSGRRRNEVGEIISHDISDENGDFVKYMNIGH